MRTIVALGLLATFLTGCAAIDEMGSGTKTGAGIGALTGGVAGAIINSKNPWMGGVIGAATGAVVGGVIGNISERAANESAKNDKSTQWDRTTDDGTREKVVAEYLGVEGSSELVKLKYYRDGRLVREEIKRVPNQ